MHRFFFAALALSFGWMAPRPVSDREVAQVHQSALLIDGHNDVPMRTLWGFDFFRPQNSGHTDFPRLKAGGVGAQFFAAYVAVEYWRQGQAAHRALEMIDTIRHDIVGRSGGQMVLGLRADDVTAAHEAGKVAALIGIEGGHAIEDSLRVLRQFYALGVRYMTLTHSATHSWANSSGDAGKSGVPRHGGLAPFGREVVREMNRLGMLVDISHVSDETFWDALKTSTAPVIASHSSCRALSNHPRNVSDDMIRALAQKGGIVMINFACEYLSEDFRKAAGPWRAQVEAIRKRLTPQYRDSYQLYAAVQQEAKKLPAPPFRPTVDDVVAHIDHVVKVGGMGAVGLGSDFDGIDCVPQGLEDVSQFPHLTRKLLERGYTAADIRKIYGENFLRVMKQAEVVAARGGR